MAAQALEADSMMRRLGRMRGPAGWIIALGLAWLLGGAVGSPAGPPDSTEADRAANAISPIELPAPSPDHPAEELALQAVEILQAPPADGDAAGGDARFRRAAALAVRARLAEDAGYVSDPDGRDAVEQALKLAAASGPSRIELETVPWVAQNGQRLCGIAAAYMLIAQRGFHPSLDDLMTWAGKRIRHTGVHVDFFSDTLPERLRVRVLAGTGSSDLVRCALAIGCCVVVLQWVTADRSTPHLRVVVGYDDAEGVFVIRDPAPELGPFFRLPYDVFEQLWGLPWRADGASHWLAFIYATEDRDP